MLEGMTTLGFMAAHSRRARLGLMVGGIHYRQAGLWLKAATTLDVLSGGPRLVRHRRGLERAGVARPGLPDAPARPALRDARGDPAHRAPRLAGRARQRDRPGGTPLPGEPPAQQPAVAEPAAPAHPHRWRRRAAHPQAGGHVRRRHQRLRHRSRASWPTSTACCDATARASAATTTSIEKTLLTQVAITPDGRAAHAHPGAGRGAPGPHHGGRGPARHLQRPRRPRPLQPGAHRPRRHPAAARPGRAVTAALSGARARRPPIACS